MPKKKLLFVFGTRPELIKLAPLIQESKKHFDIEVLCTGQHKELLDLEANYLCKWFGIEIHHNLNLMKENQSPEFIVSGVLDASSQILNNDKFEAVVVQGDTASAYAGALAAFLASKKVIHIEAGLRTENVRLPFPEEMFRRQISQIADFNFTPTKIAQKNLSKEKTIPGKTYLVGNTVIDALKICINKIEDLASQVGDDLAQALSKRSILLTMHRRENHGQPLMNVCQAVSEIATAFPNMNIIFPVHPSPMVRQVVFEMLKDKNNIYLLEPLNYLEMAYAIGRSHLIVTDSGGLQEEGTAVGRPILVLRETSERMEAVKQGNAKLVGTDRETVKQEIAKLLSSDRLYSKMSKPSNIFGDGHASEKIVKVLLQCL